jgi:hypothetical protein
MWSAVSYVCLISSKPLYWFLSSPHAYRVSKWRVTMNGDSFVLPLIVSQCDGYEYLQFMQAVTPQHLAFSVRACLHINFRVRCIGRWPANWPTRCPDFFFSVWFIFVALSQIGSLAIKTKSTWWTGRKCWACVCQAAEVCTKGWGLCWNLVLPGSVWAFKWCKNLSTIAFHLGHGAIYIYICVCVCLCVCVCVCIYIQGVYTHTHTHTHTECFRRNSKYFRR